MGRSPGVRSEARSHRAPCPWPRDPRKKAGEGQRLSGEPPGRCPLQGPEAAGPPLVPAARAPAAGPDCNARSGLAGTGGSGAGPLPPPGRALQGPRGPGAQCGIGPRGFRKRRGRAHTDARAPSASASA